jgi:hypothetical protein
MKNVLFFIAMVVAGVGFVNAAGANDVGSTSITVQQDDREKIKPEELPEAVKTTLNGDEYKGWLVQTAYRIKSKDLYEVEVKKGAETKTIRFDKDGKVVV